MRGGRVRWAILLAPALVGALLAGTPAKAAGTVSLKAAEFRFCKASATACSPKQNFTITIPRGTTVTWYYKDPACNAVAACPGHNVTFAFRAGPTRKQNGAVLFSLLFNTPGSYRYYCSIHRSFGMTGTVKVT